MTLSRTENALKGAMHDQACQWIARLRADDVSEADREAFALWLAANPAHGEAMDAMLAMWEDLEILKDRPQDTQLEPGHKPVPELDTSRRRWLATGLALAASVMVAVLLAPALQLGGERQHFQTELGEQLLVDLEDGSQIQLNTRTALDVQFDAGLRRVELQRGEAFFTVARDTARPFIVIAGNTEVRVLGTAFSVMLRGEVSEITVTHGVVRVTELDAPNTRPAQSEILRRNQRITGDRSGLARASEVAADNLLAWRDGKLVAEQMSLAQLVDELSRYHPTEIVIAEPGLASTTVSGVFRLEDLDSILLALEHTVGVRSVALADGSIQLTRAPL